MSKKSDAYYFDNFVKGADCACRAAEMFSQILKNFKIEELPQKMKELHSIEHEGDELNHATMEALSKAFITPIEREDILEISHCLDDIIDTIEDVVLRIYMCNIKTIRPEAITFADLVIKSCDTVKKAMVEFPNYKKSKTLKNYIIEINGLEEDGDKLFIDSMHELHVKAIDPVELMSWRDILNYLERCLDACEETADIIDSVVMKNS